MDMGRLMFLEQAALREKTALRESQLALNNPKIIQKS
jgi:hypothetical protein